MPSHSHFRSARPFRRHRFFALGLMGVALALGAVSTVNAAALEIEPGKWEVEMKSTNPMSPTPQVFTRTECVTAEKATWDPDELMKDVPDCSAKNVKSSANAISFVMECETVGGILAGKAEYESTGKTMSGTMDLSMQMGQMKIEVKNEQKGRHLGACD